MSAPPTDLTERLWRAIKDPGVQSIRLTLMNNPGRGEDAAYQAILYPVDTSRGTCFSILRTPEAAIRRMLDQWEPQHEPKTRPTMEDLLE